MVAVGARKSSAISVRDRYSPNSFQGQKYLAIIGARLPPRLDIDEPYLAAVKAERQVGARCQMGMIEPEPRWTWRECDPPQAMRRDEGCPLFRSPIHVCRHELTVPMKLLRRVGIVVDVDDDTLAFGKPQQRTGKLAIVECGRDCRI